MSNYERTDCGSAYQGFKCERPRYHQHKSELIDREQCWAKWGDREIKWRVDEVKPTHVLVERSEVERIASEVEEFGLHTRAAVMRSWLSGEKP